MKKCNLLVLFVTPLLLLFYSSSGHSSSTSSINNRHSNDAIANERPPLTADELAEHWKLDCQKIALVTESWAEKAVLSQHPNVSDVDLRELQLCAFIYNAQDTGRYQPCPNYKKALQVLKDIKEGNVKATPALMGSYLSSCGKD